MNLLKRFGCACEEIVEYLIMPFVLLFMIGAAALSIILVIFIIKLVI